MSKRDDFTPVAYQIPIDNSSIDCIDTSETVQEGLQELCQKIQEVGNKASPGFTWGSSGAIKNSYLQNDTVPSNLSGRLCTVNGFLTNIFIITENSDDEYTLEIRKRIGNTFTTIVTLSAISSDGKRKYSTSGLTIPVSSGDELSAYIQK